MEPTNNVEISTPENHEYSDETIPMEHDATDEIIEEHSEEEEAAVTEDIVEEYSEEEEEEEAATQDADDNDWGIHEEIPYENNGSWNRASFQSYYTCYSLSKTGKSHLEHGDQIIMPESSIETLLGNRLDFPMLFEIRNDSKERVSHCGVSEFTAEEGTVLLPNWMMKNLKLEEGELISLKSAKLEKGTYVKLQPHSVDFLGIRNPKAALEECLGCKFFCLTVGDTIKINYNNKDLFIDIVDAKPASAVCIVDTDCEVDFAAPLDYKEPVKPEVKQPSIVEEVKASNFVPFSGHARRLDGKSVGNPVQENNQAAGVKRVATESEKCPAAKSMFGSSQAQAKISEKQAKADEIPQKKEFQPFTGKKYSLMDDMKKIKYSH